MRIYRLTCAARLVAAIALACVTQSGVSSPSREAFTVVTPREDTNVVLHNPDMGWVLYENYPLDTEPQGSSTLLTLPNESFPEVDAVALMFTWQDIEQRPDEYDFSKVDFAYDYWAKRGKEIQLRLSATTLMWWANRNPPAGLGAPDYVLARMSPLEKQTRTLVGIPYRVEDARHPYYRERLTRFLRAVNTHFSAKRPVTLIDLRAFGLWGEWHSGFRYSTLKERHSALRGILDLWCDALPNHKLSLSYSYDPDGPPELYAGDAKKFDPQFTTNYNDYLRYSAFDHALKKPNITFRRDGCGGAVHSNERKLNAEAFRRGRAPMFSEFVDGYQQSAKGGTNWVNWKIEDALSLHPNYVNLLGWVGSDALTFTRERPDLIAHGLRTMGYRFVPTRVRYPEIITSGKSARIEIDWGNRAVGRALRDFELRICLIDDNGQQIATSQPQKLNTSTWIAGRSYETTIKANFGNISDGEYHLALTLNDPKSGRAIALPLANGDEANIYRVGKIKVISLR